MPNELIKTLTVDGTTYDLPTKTSELSNDSGFIISESDPVFSASAAHGISSSDISAWNAKSDFSGSYNDLTDTPTIPAAVTESTVAGWGFTKNTGTYSKPSGGIPKTDLASAVQTSLGKADTALQSFTETDPTVPSWAKQVSKPTYTASEVGALPDSTVIPSKTSDLTNDSGFITGYTETDPTVPSWAKQATKPTYTASEVGALPDSTEIDDVYWCTYGTTTSAQIETALTAGKIPMVKYQDYVYTLRYRNSATNHRFVCNYGGKEKSVACQSGTWIPNGDLTFLTTSYTAPVTSVNGQTGAVTVSVPTKVSDLTNDAGYITSYTETDPVFSASAAAGITSSDISDWDGKVDDLTDLGITATATELNYTDGVTSNIQDQLDAKADASAYLPLTGGTLTGNLYVGDSSAETNYSVTIKNANKEANFSLASNGTFGIFDVTNSNWVFYRAYNDTDYARVHTPPADSDTTHIANTAWVRGRGLKATSKTVAASAWTAETKTSTSGTAYAYYYRFGWTGVTANDFVDGSIESGTYTDNWAVESVSGYINIHVATKPTASLTFNIYFTVGKTMS